MASSYPSDGGGQSQPMQPLRPNDQRNLLFTDKNAEAQLRFVFANPWHFMFRAIFPLFSRHYQQEAESAGAKLQALNSQINELRERFKQAQREVETQNVRFE